MHPGIRQGARGGGGHTSGSFSGRPLSPPPSVCLSTILQSHAWSSNIYSDYLAGETVSTAQTSSHVPPAQ